MFRLPKREIFGQRIMPESKSSDSVKEKRIFAGDRSGMPSSIAVESLAVYEILINHV
jgi:hypothetical protein